MKYRTIVADPPWRLNQVTASKANAEKVYATMSLTEILTLPIVELAEEDAYLWLWGINSMMEEAHQVVRAWGFQPRTIVTWCKSGRPGVGAYVRNNTEHCILAIRGKPETPEHKPLASWYVWPRGPHSQKPDAFYDLVEQVSPAPYVEVFARRHRFFWDVWGNESANTATMEPSA